MRTIEDLIGKNIVVYDLEIKNEVESLPRRWASKDLMGISTAVSFDYRTLEYKVFMDDNIHELVERLNELGTMIVAFNQISFDNEILRHDKLLVDRGITLNDDVHNFDMYVESKKAAGADKFAKGYNLDAHLKQMNLSCKTDCGSEAPKMYQRGEIAKLINYNLNDVNVEKTLFEHIYVHGRVCCEGNPSGHCIEIPFYLV
jgi:hypothetical protein